MARGSNSAAVFVIVISVREVMGRGSCQKAAESCIEFKMEGGTAPEQLHLRRALCNGHILRVHHRVDGRCVGLVLI